MKLEEDMAFGRIKNFGVSALVATAILLIGMIFGMTFIFGFGIFMLVIVGLLTAAAVFEYITLII